MRAWTDERVERVIGALLRWGVLLAALGALILADSSGPLGSAICGCRVFRGEPWDLRDLSEIVRVGLRGRSRVGGLGLLLLIAVPVERVAFSVVAFALQRDHTYVVVTLIVLTILMYGTDEGGPVSLVPRGT